MKTFIAASTVVAALLSAGMAWAGCEIHKMGMTANSQAAGGFIRVGGYGYSASKPAQSDIVDTAVSAGSFTTLVQAVKVAGLVETLKGDGPFTVFAPTDAAFAKLPAGTLESLLADPDKLAAVLKFHVVPGKLDAKAVTSMSRLSTVQGSTLAVGDIAIAQTDIMTSNGIIHVIDEVLIPQS